MDHPISNARCPGCQSTRLNPGKLDQGDSWWGVNFKPQQNWINSHSMIAAACLECGLVSLFLDGADLHGLRANQPAE